MFTRPSLKRTIAGAMAACATLVCAPAFAETAFITIDFGAEFEPRQLHDQLFQSADQDPGTEMMSLDTRDNLLRERFPELTLPSVGGTKSKLDRGYAAYMESGDFDTARKNISKGLGEAWEMTNALSLRPEFAELTFNSAIVLATIYSIDADTEGVGNVLKQLTRYLPSRPLTENDVPPDILETYTSIVSSASNTHTLTVNTTSGCTAHVNGLPIDGPLKVQAGTYGITEVCDGQTSRAYVIPVNDDTTVDFTSRFAQLFTFPLSLSVQGKDIAGQPELLTEVLADLGDRLEVDQIMAAGLVPPAGEKPESYYMLLVDVKQRTLIDDLKVRPGEVATPERMNEAYLALTTDAEFVHDEPLTAGGIDWTLIGGITVGVGGLVGIGGIVLGVLADSAQADFDECNATIDCIQRRGAREDFIETRNSNALGADILYITGGVIVAGGVTLIILDAVGVFDGGSSDEEASRDWNLSLSPTDGGGYFEFQYDF